MANRKKWGGKHKYKGIFQPREGDKDYARAQCKGVNYNKGGFDTIEEAALAYNEIATEVWGKFARLNEIETIK